MQQSLSQDPPVHLVITHRRMRAKGFRENLGNDLSLEMVNIPSGNFIMGASADEAESSENERPPHTVTLQAFSMGKYPITQEQWQAIMGNNPSSFSENPKNPVECVSWHDAVEFCQKLSQKATREYRLPTEAEWEYACRAGTTTPFHFGETLTTELANYNGNYAYGAGKEGTYRRETTPVGSFNVANSFGLYDMHGNVWELCADYWHDSYENAPTDGRAWLTENGGNSSLRVMRGGSWLIDPRYCRSAIRYWSVSDVGDYSVGLRVVCSVSRTV